MRAPAKLSIAPMMLLSFKEHIAIRVYDSMICELFSKYAAIVLWYPISTDRHTKTSRCSGWNSYN